MMSNEKETPKKDAQLDKFKRMANAYEKNMGALKFRFFANAIVYIVMLGIMLYLFNSRINTNMLVIDSATGNVYTAQQQARNDWGILKIDADAHARHFYGTMWTFDHNNLDGKDGQLEKATKLGGKCITDLYEYLLKSGYYNNVMKEGYYVESRIDSVDQGTFRYMSNGRIYMKIWGTQKWTNNVFVELRKLDLELEMRVVDRVLKDNPSGMSIEAINILSNETVSKEESQSSY